MLDVHCRWEDAKLMLMRDNFFSDLVYFDKTQLSPAAISRLAEYCNSPAFTPDAVSQSSVAAARVCQWLQALHSYAQKHSELQPVMEWLNSIELQRKQVLLTDCFFHLTAAVLHLQQSTSLTSSAEI